MTFDRRNKFNFIIAAIDTSFEKRSLIMKVKTKAIWIFSVWWAVKKMNKKYTFLLYFAMIFPKINFIFWRNVQWRKYEHLKLFISYVFVKRKAILFFPILQC